MSVITLALLAGLGGSGAPEEGDTLPAGLHPAGILLLACQAIDGKPLLFEDPSLASRSVELKVPMEVSRKTIFSIGIALRTAGVHRVSHVNRRGQRFTYVTTNPRRRPREPLPYEVVVFELRHIEPAKAAEVMNEIAAGKETDLPPEQVPTRFIAHARKSQIIVRYSDARRLHEYKKALLELDQPQKPEDPLVMRRYLCEHRQAEDLLDEFSERWRKAGKPEIAVVPQKSANAILVRLPETLWLEVEIELKLLDQPKRKKRR